MWSTSSDQMPGALLIWPSAAFSLRESTVRLPMAATASLVAWPQTFFWPMCAVAAARCLARAATMRILSTSAPFHFGKLRAAGKTSRTNSASSAGEISSSEG